MLISHQAVYESGKLKFPNDVDIPEGANVLVTVIGEPKEDYFEKASEDMLDKIWNNKDDDIYEQLLEK
jgi:predicted DNA-binding antitoxin AbrB/MazE fold protein